MSIHIRIKLGNKLELCAMHFIVITLESPDWLEIN